MNPYGDSFWSTSNGLLIKILFSLVIAFSFIFFMINEGMAKVERNSCASWGIETSREVKFIRPSFFYYDCLVNTQDGWISATHLYVDESYE